MTTEEHPMMILAKAEEEVLYQEREDLDRFYRGLDEAPTVYRSVFMEDVVKAASDGLMEFVASEESQDRHGDIIRVDGWELRSFAQNPVFLFAHNTRMPPLGSVPKIQKEGRQLIAGVRWDEEDAFALEIKGKYERRFMRGVSVGFRPLEIKEFRDGFDFVKQELLELSAVPVPAHPKALKKAFEENPRPAITSTRYFDASDKDVLRRLEDLESKMASLLDAASHDDSDDDSDNDEPSLIDSIGELPEDFLRGFVETTRTIKAGR